MKTTVTHPSDTKVALKIVLGTEELEAAYQSALVAIGRDLKVPGFRKGKVPARVVAKHADPAHLQQQTVENAISRAVAEAFMAENLQVLERPAVEVTAFTPGENLEFTAEADIIPQVTLGDHTALKARPAVVTVDDSEVEEVIEHMRTNLATSVAVERPAQTGDEVVIDFVGKKDDVAFDGGTGQDYRLVLGSGQFIPGFEEGVVGHEVGQTFDLSLRFPDEYHASDLAGQDVVFTTTIKAINERQLPERDQAFAAKCGPFESMEELTDDIRRQLTEQKQREADEKVKDDLVAELVEASTVPVPDVLVRDQERSIEQDFVRNLTYRGLTLDQYLGTQQFADKQAWLEAEVRPTALKRVQAGLVLAELAKLLKVEASTDELDERLAQLRQQYGSDTQAQQQLATPEVRRDLANRMITEKTVDRLVAINIGSVPAAEASSESAQPTQPRKAAKGTATQAAKPAKAKKATKSAQTRTTKAAAKPKAVSAAGGKAKAVTKQTGPKAGAKAAKPSATAAAKRSR